MHPGESSTLKVVIYGLIIMLLACDSFPEDPNHSLSQAKTNKLMVGAMDAPPWVILDKGRVTGSEADILKGFAASMNTEIEWVEGSEETLMSMLEENVIHIVIGGITDQTPWQTRVGLTGVYKKEGIYVCDTRNQAVGDVAGKTIAVQSKTNYGAYVKQKKGIPFLTDTLEGYSGLVAMGENDLKQVSCKTCCKQIKTEHHVIAIPKGENRLLFALEKYLNEKGY